MNMRQYIDKHKHDRQIVRKLAETVGVQRIYLTQIASGHSRASPGLAQKIHQATGGEVHISDLRPDIYPPEVFQAAS